MGTLFGSGYIDSSAGTMLTLAPALRQQQAAAAAAAAATAQGRVGGAPPPCPGALPPPYACAPPPRLPYQAELGGALARRVADGQTLVAAALAADEALSASRTAAAPAALESVRERYIAALHVLLPALRAAQEGAAAMAAGGGAGVAAVTALVRRVLGRAEELTAATKAAAAIAVPTVVPPCPPVAKGGGDAAQAGVGDNSDDEEGEDDEDGDEGSSCGSDSGTATATPAASTDVLSSRGADDWRSLPRADGHGGPPAPPLDTGTGATTGAIGYQPPSLPAAASGSGGWGTDIHAFAADGPGQRPHPSAYVAASPTAAAAAAPTDTGDDSFPSPLPPPAYPELSPPVGGDGQWTPPAAATTAATRRPAADPPFAAPGAMGLVAPDSECVFCLGPVGGAGMVGACGHALCAPCGARVRLLMNKCPSCGGPLS